MVPEFNHLARETVGLCSVSGPYALTGSDASGTSQQAGRLHSVGQQSLSCPKMTDCLMLFFAATSAPNCFSIRLFARAFSWKYLAMRTSGGSWK